MSEPTPSPAPTPAPKPATDAAPGWWHGVYDEAKTIILGVAIGIVIAGHTPAILPPSPTPPIVVPPSPTPIPTPTPPPVPAWGPLARMIVVYESGKLTGKEVFFSMTFRDALNRNAPPDASNTPSWRVWDQNLDVSREPDWVDSMAKAKADFGSSTDPVLYAFDGQGRMKSVPLKGLSDVDAAAKVKELGGK